MSNGTATGTLSMLEQTHQQTGPQDQAHTSRARWRDPKIHTRPQSPSGFVHLGSCVAWITYWDVRSTTEQLPD